VSTPKIVKYRKALCRIARCERRKEVMQKNVCNHSPLLSLFADTPNAFASFCHYSLRMCHHCHASWYRVLRQNRTRDDPRNLATDLRCWKHRPQKLFCSQLGAMAGADYFRKRVVYVFVTCRQPRKMHRSSKRNDIKSIVYIRAAFPFIQLYALAQDSMLLLFDFIVSNRPCFFDQDRCRRSGTGNLRSARTFNTTRIKIFVTQVRTQHRVKTKLPDKQARRQ